MPFRIRTAAKIGQEFLVIVMFGFLTIFSSSTDGKKTAIAKQLPAVCDGYNDTTSIPGTTASPPVYNGDTDFYSEVILQRYTNSNEEIVWQECLGYQPTTCSDIYDCYADLMKAVCNALTQCYSVNTTSMTNSSTNNVLLYAIFEFDKGTSRSDVGKAVKGVLFDQYNIEASVTVTPFCDMGEKYCGSQICLPILSKEYPRCIMLWVFIAVGYGVIVVIIAFCLCIWACVKYRKTSKKKKAGTQQPQELELTDVTQQQPTATAVTPNPVPSSLSFPSLYPSPSSNTLHNISSLIPRVRGEALPRLSGIARPVPITPLSAVVAMDDFDEDDVIESASTTSSELRTRRFQIDQGLFEIDDSMTVSERIKRHEMISLSVREPQHTNTAPRLANTLGRTDLAEWKKTAEATTSGLPRSNYEFSSPSAQSSMNINQLFRQIQSDAYEEI